MHCPFCQHSDTRVIDSRVSEDGATIRRRRVCEACGERFSTLETIELKLPSIIKSDGRREAFDARKLRLGDRALLDLRAFAVRSFSVEVLLVAVSMMALFGTLILLPLYLQNVLGLSVLNTGLLLLPGGLAMGLLAPVVGRLFDMIGPRRCK